MKINGYIDIPQITEDSDCEDYPKSKRFSLLRGVLYALGITLVVVLFVLWLVNKVKG